MSVVSYTVQLWLAAALLCVGLPLGILVAYTLWVCFRYLATIMRIFEEAPIFAPPDEPPIADADNVRFQTSDGLWLQGSWLAARATNSRGTVVFCHEYLSNRWSCAPYCEILRDNGFDVFTFDFRNHGESDSMVGYVPMHWATAHEVCDLRAALGHVRSRAEGKSLRISLLGISRGGSASILAAAAEPCVLAVATDGAFPTHLTQSTYMMRWAGIYVGNGLLYQLTPVWYYSFVCSIVRYLGGRRHGCRFPKVERAIRRLSPRRLLMIHGEKDSYIVPEIAKQLYRYAGESKEFWLVPEAKHNAAILVAGESYRQRLLEFFDSSR